VQAEKLRVIQGALVEAGYEVPIYTAGYAFQSGEVVTALLNSLRRQNPRAIVCSTIELVPDAVEELRRTIESGGLVVTYDSAHDLECDRVIFDRTDSTGAATRHLLELGHRRLGYFHHNKLRSDDPRFLGFCAALREFGLESHADWNFDAGKALDPEAAGDLFAARFLALPKRNRPTGAVIVNDHSALTFIAALSRAGVRVPNEVSVVGHDDRPLSRYAAPALSSAAHPVEAIGNGVVELLKARLEGFDGPPQERVIKGELHARQSSAAPL